MQCVCVRRHETRTENVIIRSGYNTYPKISISCNSNNPNSHRFACFSLRKNSKNSLVKPKKRKRTTSYPSQLCKFSINEIYSQTLDLALLSLFICSSPPPSSIDRIIIYRPLYTGYNKTLLVYESHRTETRFFLETWLLRLSSPFEPL